MNCNTTEQRKRGRPRSLASRDAILRAAADLVAPGQFARLTMEGIAQRAGVSKQTVYRWWPTKIDVLVESIGEGYLTIPLPFPEDTGDLEQDLTVWLQALRDQIEEGGASSLSQALVGAMAVQDGRGRAIESVLVEPLTASLAERLRSAGAEDEDHLCFVVDGVGASIMMRVLFGRPITEDWIRRMVHRVVNGPLMTAARGS